MTDQPGIVVHVPTTKEELTAIMREWDAMLLGLPDDTPTVIEVEVDGEGRASMRLGIGQYSADH